MVCEPFKINSKPPVEYTINVSQWKAAEIWNKQSNFKSANIEFSFVGCQQKNALHLSGGSDRNGLVLSVVINLSVVPVGSLTEPVGISTSTEVSSCDQGCSTSRVAVA